MRYSAPPHHYTGPPLPRPLCAFILAHSRPCPITGYSCHLGESFSVAAASTYCSSPRSDKAMTSAPHGGDAAQAECAQACANDPLCDGRFHVCGSHNNCGLCHAGATKSTASNCTLYQLSMFCSLRNSARPSGFRMFVVGLGGVINAILMDCLAGMENKV